MTTPTAVTTPPATSTATRPGRRLPLSSLRSSGLLIVILVTAVVLELLTDGLFLSPRNLTNLAVAATVTAVLASGTVPLMVTGNIDLSPAATVAITGMAAAWLSTSGHQSVTVTVLASLGLGLIIGLWHGLWVVVGRVPSFIVTLASLLGLGGLAIAITAGQTFPVSPAVVALSQAMLPTWLAIVGGLTLIAGSVAFADQDRRARLAGGASAGVVQTVVLAAAKTAVVVVIVLAVSLSYRGLPVPVAVVVLIATLVNVWTKYTPSGRKLYAVGGSPRAAVLAGIPTGRYVMAVFLVQGVMYGVAGVLSVSYVASASPSGNTGLELAVITAAVIGGTSLFGGVGSVFGALLGTLLTAALQNGLQLRNVDASYVQIIIALVLLVAVLIDIRARSSSAR